MRNVRVIIKNYKCIKECNIDLSSISFLIGSNGTGKSTIIDAISYFYLNLTQNNISQEIFDKNNYFSNSVSITLIYDLRDIIKRARRVGGADNFLDQKEQGEEKHGIYGARKRTSSRPI